MSSSEVVNLDVQGPVIQQGVDSSRTYSFDLSSILGDDTLASCIWTVTPAGVAATGVGPVSGTALRLALSGGAAGTWYAVRARWTSVAGQQDDFVARVFIEEDEADVSNLGTALFPNRFTAVARMRSNSLLMSAAGIMPRVTVTDDYLWDKLRASEAETQRELRVKFQPTAYFPIDPTSDELAGLNGMPWEYDPGYDFGPENFVEDKWGFIITRNKPLISVTSVKMVYPNPGAVNYQFPNDWLRMDRKYGHIRIVPTSVLSMASLSASIMQLFSSRTLPQALELRYVAGLANPAADYPELVDLVLKKAALKIIGDRFLPQSRSISADGLSQSFSNDMAKHYESIDLIMNGPKGSNGGLMTAIHGVRMNVF